ncbi:MAG: GNAT family N-acetyltransferase [Chloroflexia bacterium]|nr:GNAT family N-acetyltransferase [Chloroflexia bacterium]
MTGDTLTEIDLDGDEYQAAVTSLLLAARGDDPMAGLWEAGDLQWWWSVDKGQGSRRDTVWLDAGGQPVACLLTSRQDTGNWAPGSTDCELLWKPRFDAAVREQVFPIASQRLAKLESGPDAPVSMDVDEREGELRARLEAVGFRHDPEGDIVQMWQSLAAMPDPIPLPAGLRFDDDRSRPPGQPHHLARRNGELVAQRLREQSLYRPDLDLCIRAETGEVAAYCLGWLDAVNGVGLFEPVRTEDTWQRRGLGRALLTEGIRRFMSEGASLIKVSRMRNSEAARGLYASVGFQDAFATLRYVKA